ncbi:MAG: O-antigen ligase family protein [Clostridiales bacterium]|nr:O-antigen ligase family protein [Clostridiales bacterium]
MIEKGIKRYLNPLAVAVVIAFFTGGCFSLWSASVVAIVMCVFMFFLLKQKGGLVLPFSLPAFIIVGVVIAYGLVVFFAADRAMAFLGFVKMTAVTAFLLLCFQTIKEDDKKTVWNLVPLLGGLSVVVCIGGVFLTFLTGESYFFQDDRLGGFLGYANTYALWLLLGLVVIAFQDKLRGRDYLLFALNVCGIYLAISRSLTVISLVALALLFILRPAARKLILTMAISGVALAVLVLMFRGMQGDFSRLLEAPGQASEWLSRLIYYKDGLRQIAVRPAGWGYLGYWYSQPAYQSAFYDTRFVHSSILQYALDIGVIPALSLLVLGVMLIFNRKTPLMEKIILSLICGHSLIDIDLEFLLLMFIICLVIRPVALKTVKSKLPVIIMLLLASLHLYCGLTAFAADQGPAKLALALYPCHTDALEQQMMSAATLEEAVPYAQRLAKRNDYTFLALDTFARDSFSQGHTLDAVSFKLDSLSINRFLADDYLELLSFCAYGYESAMAAGDEKGADYYRQLIVSIPLMMEQASQSLNKDAYLLKHKPDLQLPYLALEYIENITK